MLIQLIRSYSLKLVFVLSLLLAIQLPNFVHQYEIRLDAHLLEAKGQLVKYQALADLFFAGDINALIKKHQESRVSLFEAEASIVAELVSRVDYLQSQQNALQGSLISRFYYVLGEFNHPLFLETEKNYNAEIVLNKEAITVGVVFALLTTLTIELLFIFLAYLARGKRALRRLN